MLSSDGRSRDPLPGPTPTAAARGGRTGQRPAGLVQELLDLHEEILGARRFVEERVGVRPGQSGAIFKLNPRVDDLPEKYAAKLDGIRLMAMGRIKRGGTGCYCPEGALLQALIGHLLIQRNEVVILDMEAGIEHLSRGTTKAVDRLIIVVEPGSRSIETAQTIFRLAKDIGVENIAIVGNKIRDEAEQKFITASLPEAEFLGFIPYDPAITEADLAGRSVVAASLKATEAVKDIYHKLVADKQPSNI